MSLFSKLILLILGFLFLYVGLLGFVIVAYQFCLRLLWCFQLKFFRNLDFGIEWFLRCKAMELESSRCIVSRQERVVVVRTTYAMYIYIYKVCQKSNETECAVRAISRQGYYPRDVIWDISVNIFSCSVHSAMNTEKRIIRKFFVRL